MGQERRQRPQKRLQIIQSTEAAAVAFGLPASGRTSAATTSHVTAYRLQRRKWPASL
ncbi:hypothetical protein A1F94_010561 [Pyrenophora tritici-repentis]|uniref:Uncharacterized protein n=1 Tax=Pyrenophora tritici-repentis TaxID=45151 RepID=A0A316ZS85_9PLEO|nr:hypothetical protein PtrV1_11754 [Pyrenophora tritici-repentis]KAF7444552.1 hypothetical protein A1F99_111050 [Pyrenophora tritici-repentis]KAG9378792.1 hypothetical protein A1F94_010561 [Pyrenophora tritici-repentis]KAI0575081.1 hypothetical protein Alg215_08221 [Pyrenophora tritici-repentis]KAI0620733.1 hypothetical protein TUN199_07277 [Pyrenophora tritici-repentis]